MGYYDRFPILLKQQTAPSGTVLENFEGTPLVSNYTWTKNFAVTGIPITSVVVVSSSTSHVTEGAKSWELTGVNNTFTNPLVGIITTTTTNVSAYTNISLDIYVQTVAGVDTVVNFGVGDGTNFSGVSSTSGATGAATLTIPVAQMISDAVNTAAVYFLIYASDNVTNGAVDYFIDKMRAS